MTELATTRDQQSCRPCILCGGRDLKPLFHSAVAGGTIVQCRNDALVFLGDPPPPDTLSSRRDIQGEAWQAAWELYRQEQAAKLATFRQRLTYLPSPKPGHDRLLDIGCGAGFFLQVASEAGWQAIGVEPTQSYVDYARQELKQRVVWGMLQDGRFDDDAFDVVCLFHVFEHFREPVSNLKEIRRILKPDGALLIEAPNIDTVWFRLLRSRWRQIQKGHYVYYSPTTLIALLDKMDFDVQLVESVGKWMSFHYFATRLARYSGGLARTAEALFRTLRLDRREINLNLGDIMLAVASPKQVSVYGSLMDSKR